MPGMGGILMPTPFVDQVVTGVDFEPQLVLILNSNHGTVDTLEAVGGLLGLGAICTASDRARPYSMCNHFMWGAGTSPGSSYLWDLASWTRGGPNGAMYATSMDPDGFTLAYSPSSGFNNSSGVPHYWLAITGPNPPELEVSRPPPYGFNASDEIALTPELEEAPTSAISIGGGADSVGVGSAGAYTDSALPTWAIWSKSLEDESSIYDAFGGGTMNLAYGIRNFCFNSFWYTDYWTDQQFAYDAGPVAISTVATGAWHLGSDEAGPGPRMKADWHYPGGAFVGNYGRTGIIACGNMLGKGGELFPSGTVGAEQSVTVPFEIAAVVFFCEGYQINPGGFPNVQVGPSIGFAAADNDFQAVVSAGGTGTGVYSRYQSSNRAWVSNYNGPGGSGIHAGTCTIDGDTFTIKTEESDRPPLRIMFTALGFVEQDIPGFFRRY